MKIEAALIAYHGLSAGYIVLVDDEKVLSEGFASWQRKYI
jgi:ribulose 1,5-bisphosphate carboxylase large subunit-like protein